MAKLPCCGGYYRRALYQKFLQSYDIIVNFISAHDEATKLIQSTIQDKKFVEKVVAESRKNRDDAESYKLSQIEDAFPEISQAV